MPGGGRSFTIQGMGMIIEVTVAPSFEGHTEYVLEEIIQGAGERKYRLTKTQSQGMDLGASPPPPVLREMEAALLEPELTILLELPVGICPEGPLGLDGTTTTVRIERGMNSVEFSWWEDPPEEWKNLERLIQLFEKA